MGMGFENCEGGFGKKNEMENGIGTPFSTLIYAFNSQGPRFDLQFFRNV